MITLSSFVGEIVDDICKARSYADYSSAVLSEKYFADPFINGLPIPHYTIDDVEIEVPVMVVGVKTDAEDFEKNKKCIVEITEKKLPSLLLQTLKFNYYKKIDEEKKEKTENNKRREVLIRGDKYSGKNASRSQNGIYLEENEKHKMPEEILNQYIIIAENISNSMKRHLEKYLNEYNYEVLKLLDVTENFGHALYKKIKSALVMPENDDLGNFTDTEIKSSSRYVSNIMFFEYKKIIGNNSGVQIDVNTSQMNEFSAKFDCLMHIKLKIREQDLNLLVEDKDGKEVRYLSLT